MSPLAIKSKLKSLFSLSVKTFKKLLRHVLFLDLYAGTGDVHFALTRRRYSSLGFDIGNGPHFDFTHRRVHAIIKGWMSSGCIGGIMLAAQCSSWSRAQHGPIGSSWGPIRSKQHILGLPNLLPRDLCKVK